MNLLIYLMPYVFCAAFFALGYLWRHTRHSYVPIVKFRLRVLTFFLVVILCAAIYISMHTAMEYYMQTISVLLLK